MTFRLTAAFSGNLQEIEKAARSAALLTQQLLAFPVVRILRPKVLNINEIIANLAKMLCSMVGDRIEIQLLTARDLGNVMLDPGQFERILINLVLNARDAMPDGGVIRMATGNVALSETECGRWPDVKPGDYVRLTFSDNGVGMSAEVIDHLFEPFFTTKFTWSCYRPGLVGNLWHNRQAGGFIKVDSAPGKGTIFEICASMTTRAVDQEASGTRKSRRWQRNGAARRRRRYRQIYRIGNFEKLGYNSLEAANGREAL